MFDKCLTRTQKNPQNLTLKGFLVLEAGLEPARRCRHWILSPTCLPIPPLEHPPINR